MASKFYQVKKEIHGKEYIAQFSGISAALKAVDSSKIDDTDVTSIEKLSNYLLENVIVEPKNLTPDDFDSMAEFNEVIAFARGVMQGDFRAEAIQSAAESKGKK